MPQLARPSRAFRGWPRPCSSCPRRECYIVLIFYQISARTQVSAHAFRGTSVRLCVCVKYLVAQTIGVECCWLESHCFESPARSFFFAAFQPPCVYLNVGRLKRLVLISFGWKVADSNHPYDSFFCLVSTNRHAFVMGGRSQLRIRIRSFFFFYVMRTRIKGRVSQTTHTLIRVVFGWKAAVSMPSRFILFCVYFFVRLNIRDMRSLWLKGRSLKSREFFSLILFFSVRFYTSEQVDMRSLWLEGRSLESLYELFSFLCFFLTLLIYLPCGHVSIVGTIITINVLLV